MLCNTSILSCEWEACTNVCPLSISPMIISLVSTLLSSSGCSVALSLYNDHYWLYASASFTCCNMELLPHSLPAPFRSLLGCNVPPCMTAPLELTLHFSNLSTNLAPSSYCLAMLPPNLIFLLPSCWICCNLPDAIVILPSLLIMLVSDDVIR